MFSTGVSHIAHLIGYGCGYAGYREFTEKPLLAFRRRRKRGPFSRFMLALADRIKKIF